ncbi:MULTISPECIES: carbohydrate ABC transporter permease [Heyndrickxia]|jgi:sn-glycerol 3-phosphate transport system permease protein|uniref:carbohydrate ABC transporter permease n=1 Tax=Heyndrickxia TaxID=2837504 RepID=UPI0003AA59B9|nr:carbohydrate ABC transporter permease [Heyndrickxia oleronia]MCI1589944.1 carbohydrate ABC transporter permease [Heyndrickxia oleronia]MCI1611655.1 carbohydrate ABC transporter permease [Heyndrickxia oleronia]MCI1743570.1 carbohydrate ABC transporter permease [Heyndrickxia oleronia]MCI1760177.1 carbohydrate ABC transporter permease [Heyndrickxia oleronia]
MFKRTILYILLIFSTIIVFGPIVYALLISLMDSKQVFEGAIIPTSPTLGNYVDAFTTVPLLRFLFNSIIQSTLITIGMIITCSLAAFAFVFVPFKGRNIVFLIIISTMMIPWEATIIPNFATVRDLGWMNTYAALVIPKFAGAFGIFLLRQYFLTIPKELHEAAQMDGCSNFRFYIKMIMPISKPMIATLGIYTFLSAWNEYLWPLLVTNDNSVRTIQIGLKMMKSEETANNWPMIMAAVILVIIPTLLILFIGQKQLQKGLTSGSLKG